MQRNAKKLLAKLSLTISLLLLSAVGVSAADYVIYYNGSYVCLDANGTGLTITTTFNPNTCLWTCYNGTTETTIGTSSTSKRALKNKSTGYYLNINTSTLSLSLSTSGTSYWYSVNSYNTKYLCYKRSNSTRYCINADGSISSRTDDNFSGQAFAPEIVTTTFHAEVNNASVSVYSDVTAIQNVGSSASVWTNSVSGNYTAEYTTYSFYYNGQHNYWSGADHGYDVPTIYSGSGCVYEWSLDPSSSGYENVSFTESGEGGRSLNYLSDAGSTVVAKVILTVTHPDYPGFSLTDDIEISLISANEQSEYPTNKYVFSSGENYFSNNNGNISNSSQFNPNTCIWQGTNGGTFSNGDYSLYGTSSYVWYSGWTYSVSLSTTNSSNVSYNNQNGGTLSWYSNTTVYLLYNNGWTTTTSSGSATNGLYSITRIGTIGEISISPTISGDETAFTNINSSKSYTYTAASYCVGYKNYVFKNANYYIGNNGTYYGSVKPAAQSFTYSWSLSSNAAGHASVDANGNVSYNTYFEEDANVTLTLTASSPDKTFTVEKTLAFIGNRIDPVSITANDIELENGNTTTIAYTISPTNAFKYVTFESADPSIASVNADGVVTGVFVGGTTITIRAYKWDKTTVAVSKTINVTVTNNPGTSPDKPYYISSQSGLDYIRTHLANYYVVSADIDLSGFSSISGTFTGSIDGGYHVIRGLTSSLFTSTNNATIKNLVLDDVNITSGTNVGPLVNEAAGATRIYNCGVRATNSSSVTGTGYVGGLIGRINNNTRVINCYSFANVSGGSWAAGIVGYNPTATTTSNITTAGLIMNCMYYGRIISGTNRAPVYGGSIISNAGNTGINNYNYYSLSSNINPTTYNCALAAEERYLTRFEFYRGILNSNRKLCAFYVKGSVGSTDEIGKWVLDPSIAKYPIIKAWGKYPSIINRSTVDAVSKNAYEGKGLGTLSVTINRGSYGSGSSSETISLPITDIDTLNYDYNYYKVQLPYYNDYFSGNYSGNKVVTGWRVTAISGGTAGTFSTSGNDAYNFANRYCTAKDLYSTSGAVFAQGGFFNVPEGVTAITIQANWASAVYLSDPNYDKVYTTAYSGSNYTVAGSVPTSYNSQTVYTTLANAISNVPTGSTVYDAAIVLVGNYHTYSESWDNGTKPFTVMSVDDNGDNEPDYCMIHGHSSDRVVVNPIRFDFLWHPGLGMTSKVTGTTQMPNQSIFKPKGHFEITETALARYTEFEYDYSGKANSSPLILMGGIFEQFVSIFNDGSLASHTSYLKVGGNAFVNAFTPGCHPEQTTGTNHQPISVLGGEYPEFYLSGLRPNAATTATNANCYVNGGRFHMFAGACYEQINGNVTIKVDHALVDEFYGGGINSASPITGNINVTIDNSRVRFYCGGPKFGDMGIGKTVNTNATGSTFSEYYGAGFGGTSISSVVTDNTSSAATYPTNYFTSFSNNRGSYDATNGIMTGYKMEFFDWAGGTTTSHVARFYVNRASLSLAMARNVTSTLNNCTILNNFYGGGCLGTVNGTITSTLNNCTVFGNVFGGGYSVDIPVCDVYPTVTPTFPAYDGNTGTFSSAILPTPTKHTWSNLGSTSNPFTTNENGNWIFTNVDFSNLGKVSGNTIVTVTGASRIDGALFGGGDESMVTGNTNVNVSAQQTYKISNVFGGGNVANVGGNTVVDVSNGQIGNIFGGGNNAGIGGSTSVTVLDGDIIGNVYGGGNQGDVTGNTSVQIGTSSVP